MSAVEMLSSAAPAKSIPTGEELVQRARALAPKLRERALRAERERNIPLESVGEYIQAGLLRTIMPKRWGGYEHDHEVQFNIAIELGRSTCGSSAWCLNYLSDHAGILAHFPDEAQHDVWDKNRDACIATSAAPTGKAEVVPGGYRLNGQWSWSSGIRHSHWVMIGGLIQREGEHHPDMRLLLVPASDLKILDTWYCAGLRASRLEHGRARQRVRAGAPQRVVQHAARRLLARLADQHRADLPHAVHRGPHLCAARSGARARARRLCRFRAMDAPALSHLHRAQRRPARAGADPRRRDRGADRRG